MIEPHATVWIALTCLLAGTVVALGGSWGWRRYRRGPSTENAGKKRGPAAVLLDQTPSPAWLRDANLRISQVNAAYVSATGATSTEQVIVEQRELGAGQLGGDGKSLANRVLRTGIEQTESVSVVIDGRRRLFQITERLIGFGQIAGIAEDMTALDSALGDLAAHMNSHQEVLEQMRAGIAVFDGERRLRFVNRAYGEMWGLNHQWLGHGPKLSEILETLREQRNLPEVIDFAAFRRQMDLRFQTVIEPQEQLMHLPDSRCFREVCAPHPLGGLMFVYEDVTDRLALESSYNTLIDVQRDILDHLADGLAAFGTDGRLSIFNPAFAYLIGTPEDRPAEAERLTAILERIGRLTQDTKVWSRFCEVAQQSVNARNVIRQRTFLGDGRAIDVALAPLADGGVLMTIRDITDTYNVERVLLERNAALEEANRLKTDFLANASYELRTPLTTISGFAEMLSAQVGGPITDQQHDYLEGILRASETLAALIDSILDVSPGEGGQLDLQAADLALAPVLYSVAQVVRPQLESKSVRLSIRVDPRIGPIQADERRLRQLVFNLLSAASRLSANQSTITLACDGSADTVTISAQANTTLSPAEVRAIESELTLMLVQRLTEIHGGSMYIGQDDRQVVTITCVLARKRSLRSPPRETAAA